MDKETVCPICSSKARRWAEKNGFHIQKCAACGHGFAWPRPSRIVTNRLYMELDLEEALRSRSYKRRQRAGEDEPEVVAERLARLGCKGGRLLDVGAGSGRFTDHFRHNGFAVTPLEVHPLLAQRIEQKTGLGVVRQPFEAWALDERLVGSFDAIVISQVVEHIVSPPEWFAQSRRLLKPDGVLFVSIPNFHSLLVRIMGAREGNICPPTHLNFFTMKSFTSLAGRHGLRLRLAETPSILPLEPAIDAVKVYLKLPETPLSALPGAFVWSLLAVADRLGLGRFLHGYFSPAGLDA